MNDDQVGHLSRPLRQPVKIGQGVVPDEHVNQRCQMGSGLVTRARASRVAMVEMSEIICIRNSEGFLAVVTNQRLAGSPVFDGLSCTSGKEKERNHQTIAVNHQG